MNPSPLTWQERREVAADAIYALWRAVVIRLRRKLALIHLPLDSSATVPSSQAAEAIVRQVTRITALFFAWKRRRCFYRAYAIAYVLRKRGMALVLNIGNRRSRKRRRMRGHCWLTLGDELFAEDTNPHDDYGTYMGEHDGMIRYWCGEG